LIASARIYAADPAKHTSAEVPAAPRLDDRYVAEALVRGAATAGRMRSSPTGVVLHAYRVTDPWCFDARLGTWSSAELAFA
jgi:hypothetical protein